LIKLVGYPLIKYEKVFAVDSTGFPTMQYGRWFNPRLGKDLDKRKFIKAHIMCGVKSNIITAVIIKTDRSHDSKYFLDLVKQSAELYTIKEVCADKAYTSHQNIHFLVDMGAMPYIPFKKNASLKTGLLWRRFINYFDKNPIEFYQHYHQRSNIESTNNMLKINFARRVRPKKPLAQINSLLVRCLCHNLKVVAQETAELGIKPDYTACSEHPIAQKLG
jgi:transposase